MCQYCDTSKDSVPEAIGEFDQGDVRCCLRLHADWLELWESGPEVTGVTKAARLNFCPVCGKPLVPGIDHVSMAAMK